METYEFEGKTTEEAIKAASRELNLPVEELDVDILEPGSAGIFGLVGGKKARIRVSFSEPSPEESQDEFPEEPEEKREIPLKEEEDLPAAQVQEEKTREEEPEEAREEEPEEAREEAREVEPEFAPEDIEVAKTALGKILSLIPMEAAIHAEHADGKITLNIDGDKSGLLIGRKGKTLDALQFIVNKIVNKSLERKVHVVVDSENYRKRREDSLIQLALKMGDKAKRIRKPVTTSPMNPHDRRIVHLALKEDGRLDTRSRGDGLLKKVVIIPKR